MKFLRRLFGGGKRGTVDQSRHYRTYRYQPFRHLEFNILEDWQEAMNGMETVFTMPEFGLPQLFMQTVGKTEAFANAREFCEFATAQSDEDVFAAVDLDVGGFPAVQWDYREPHEGLQARALAVDVGEGILWFYLKADQSSFSDESIIMDELKASFSFK